MAEGNADQHYHQGPDQGHGNNIQYGPAQRVHFRKLLQDFAADNAGQATSNGKGAQDGEQLPSIDLPLLLKFFKHAAKKLE